MINKLIVFVMGLFFERVYFNSESGHGNYESERCWLVRGRYVSAERFLIV